MVRVYHLAQYKSSLHPSSVHYRKLSIRTGISLALYFVVIYHWMMEQPPAILVAFFWLFVTFIFESILSSFLSDLFLSCQYVIPKNCPICPKLSKHSVVFILPMHGTVRKCRTRKKFAEAEFMLQRSQKWFSWC